MQWNYYSFNVIPNEPGEVGLQIPGFINNLGTNIFIPNITILRRYEFADNFTVIRGHHTFKFGGYELLRGNHTESHTFFPGRFVFGSLPGFLISPCLAPTHRRIPAGGTIDRRLHQPVAIGIVRAASGLPAGIWKSDLPLLHPPADCVLRARLLEDNAKLHSELRPPLRTGHAIRSVDHVQEGFCARGFPSHGTHSRITRQ